MRNFGAIDVRLDLGRAAPLPEQPAGSRADSAAWRARDSRIVTSTYVDGGRFASCAVCVDIEASARKHGVDDNDMLHALRHHCRAFETGEGAVTMFIGPSTNAQPFDVGLIFSARCGIDDVVALARPSIFRGYPRVVERYDAARPRTRQRRGGTGAARTRVRPPADSTLLAAALRFTHIDGARPTPALALYGAFDRARTSDSRLRHRSHIAGARVLSGSEFEIHLGSSSQPRLTECRSDLRNRAARLSRPQSPSRRRSGGRRRRRGW